MKHSLVVEVDWASRSKWPTAEKKARDVARTVYGNRDVGDVLDHIEVPSTADSPWVHHTFTFRSHSRSKTCYECGTGDLDSSD